MHSLADSLAASRRNRGAAMEEGPIRAGGDIDTNAAIVGGIVALAVGIDAIPKDWRKDREQLVI